MYGSVLSVPDKRASELRDGLRSEQSGCVSVCHVCEGIAWAGAEVQVTTLLRSLSRCSGISLHAIVFQEGRLSQELRSLGVTVQAVSEHQKSIFQAISECSEFLKSRNIQILHSHNYKENLIALMLSRVSNVPHLIRTAHGNPEPYSVVRHPKHWCVLAADRLAAKYTATRIVSVSSDLGEFWKRHADPKRVSILRNGVDLEYVNSSLSPTEAKLRLGISGDRFVVGIAARLECIKRHDLFLATASYLAEKIPDANFVIAGDGRQKELLEQLIVESGLEDRVALLGDRKDVYDVLRAMDVLLICSDHEGIPMVMLEAMALGVAVVARKVGGMPEVIRNGVNGILVSSDSPEELGRACMAIFENPLFHTNLTEAARDEIHRWYSADKNAEIMAELYRTICSEPLPS